jgi:hypothetical protein
MRGVQYFWCRGPASCFFSSCQKLKYKRRMEQDPLSMEKERHIPFLLSLKRMKSTELTLEQKEILHELMSIILNRPYVGEGPQSWIKEYKRNKIGASSQGNLSFVSGAENVDGLILLLKFAIRNNASISLVILLQMKALLTRKEWSFFLTNAFAGFSCPLQFAIHHLHVHTIRFFLQELILISKLSPLLNFIFVFRYPQWTLQAESRHSILMNHIKQNDTDSDYGYELKKCKVMGHRRTKSL